MKGGVRDKIKKISESFRLHKNSDISLESPMNLVISLVAEAIQNGETNQTINQDISNVVYFPRTPELMRSAKILMYSRLQNSNCHHFKIRGQWFIRNGLKKVAKALNLKLDDIIQLTCPEEIDKLLETYKKLTTKEERSSNEKEEKIVEKEKSSSSSSYSTLTIMVVAGLSFVSGFILSWGINKLLRK
jgi:hypothetical protein